MAVENAYTPKIYVSDGSQTTYPYDFRVLNASDMVVQIKNNVSGAITTLTYGTDYTVTNVNQESGNVVLTAAPANGYIILLYRNIASTQGTRFLEYGEYPSAVLETVADKLTMLVQQLEEIEKRTLKVSSFYEDINFDPTVPVDPDKILGINSSGTGIKTITVAEAGGLSSVEDDDNPTLGGNLKTNAKDIVATGFDANVPINITAKGSSSVNLNKLQIASGGNTISSIKDEDNMTSNSVTALCTQQSIKAYVDNSISTSATSTLSSAKSYTDSSATSTLSSANSYTDTVAAGVGVYIFDSYTTPGTATWNKPSGVKKIMVEMVGAGGHSRHFSNDYMDGGCGGYIKFLLDVSSIPSLVLTVGAATSTDGGASIIGFPGSDIAVAYGGRYASNTSDTDLGGIGYVDSSSLPLGSIIRKGAGLRLAAGQDGFNFRITSSSALSPYGDGGADNGIPATNGNGGAIIIHSYK